MGSQLADKRVGMGKIWIKRYEGVKTDHRWISALNNVFQTKKHDFLFTKIVVEGVEKICILIWGSKSKVFVLGSPENQPTPPRFLME